MSATLVLLGGEAPDAPMSWLRVRRSDRAVLGRGSLAGGGQAPQGTNDCILVLRGAEVQIRALELPAKTEAQARGAAAFAFEGQIADEAGKAVYAIGAGGPDNRRLVAAIDRQRLSAWIASCRAANAIPRSILIDVMLPAVNSGIVRVLERDGLAMLVGGVAGGLAIETPLAPALFGAWLQRQEGAKPQLVVEGAALGGVAHALQALGYETRLKDGGDVEAELARAALTPPVYAPELRQGEFAPEAGRKKRSAMLATAVGLAVAAAALQIGLLVFEGLGNQKMATEIAAKVEHDFRELRPDVKRIVNLRAQLSAALNAARRPATHPVVSSSYLMVEALQAHPDARLEDVRYAAPGRRVSMRVSGPQPGALEPMIADLRKLDAKLEVDEMRADQGRISVVIRLAAP